MRSHDALKSEEAESAGWEATKGAGMGALKWGIGVAILGGAAQIWSPVYRGMTIQFKVFIHMTGMVFGGMIEGENRLQQYEAQMRMQRQVQREQAKWQRYQEEFIQSSNSKNTEYEINKK